MHPNEWILRINLSKKENVALHGTEWFVSVGDWYLGYSLRYIMQYAEPHSSVGSVADLRTGGRWFDLRLGQYSPLGLVIVTATGFIPLLRLSIILTMVMWESSQWLGKNIVQSTGLKNSRKAWIGALAAAI